MHPDSKVTVSFIIVIYYFWFTQIFTNGNELSIPDYLKKSKLLRDKLKGGLRLKLDGPSDDVRYSPLRQLEYPRNDAEKLRKLKELWAEYYSCLEAQHASLGHHRRIPPTAVTVLENRNVHLPCDLCQSPQQADYPVTWYKLDSLYDQPMAVAESENIIISQDDTLSIYRAQPELAGIYYCQSGDTKTSPYYVHIFGDEEPLVTVKPAIAKKGPYALIDEPLTNEIKITTVWSDWSKCSRCNKVGRKKRFGACTIVASTKPDLLENQLNTGLQIGNASLEEGYIGFLMLFTQGLPCRSRLLPMWIRNLEKVDRANEMMLAFCNVSCVDTIFETHDKFGHLLEMANNSAGIFSSLQGPPHIGPVVSRATYYCPLNQLFALLCPGTLYVEAPVDWYINKTVRIVPWLVEKRSNGRMYIDSRERLVFNTVEARDARFYSCWQDGQIAGIARIVVFEPNVFSINHHMILLGTISILALFLYLFIRFYLNKTKAGTF